MARKNLLLFKGASGPRGIIGKSSLGSGTVKLSFTIEKPIHISVKGSGTDKSAKAKFEQIKNELKAAVHTVLSGKKLQRSFSSVYKDLELMLMFKHSEQGKLADWILVTIDDRFNKVELEQFKALLGEDTDPILFADRFADLFQQWRGKLAFLLKLFTVLDRSYLLQHPRKDTIEKHGLSLVVQNLFLSPTVESEAPVGSEALTRFGDKLLLHCERATLLWIQDPSCSDLALTLVGVINALSGVVDFSFPRRFKDSLQRAFAQLQNSLMDDETTYMRCILGLLTRGIRFLESTNFEEEYVEEVRKLLYWKTIFHDFANMLEPSFSDLMLRENRDYLNALVRLADETQEHYSVNLIQTFLYVWAKHVASETASTIDASKATGTLLVPAIISLWSRLIEMFDECSYSQQLSFEMRGSISKAFSLKGHNKFVLMQLSKFCEGVLKSFPVSVEQFQKLLADAVIFFKLIPNKQDFFVLYERDVSKRVLLGRNFNLDAEEALLTALVEVVGDGDETQNLNAMMRDLKTSSTRYSGLHMNASPSIELNSLVLERKYWPEIPKQGTNVVLPEHLNGILSEFTAQYANESEKSKLQVLDWSNYSLHQLTIDVAFANGSKELTMTLVQAVLLMLFEERSVLTLHELVTLTHLEDKLVKRIVASLSTEKYPILLVDGETVVFNENFSDRLSKIRIPLGRDKEAALVDDAQRRINRNRGSEIRAALVRVMKAERTLTYPELLGKTTEQLSVAVPVHDLKEHIDYLITNEFVRRDERSNTLHYIP